MLTDRPILMYHSIYSERPHRGGVAREQLHKHFEWLSTHGWRGRSIRDSLGRQGPRDVCLTFDDGYENNLLHALPLLEEFGFTATFFVCTRMQGQVLEWHAQDPQPLMGADGWLKLASSGHEVASHGLTHRRVDLLDENEMLMELRESKAQIEAVVGSVAGYAYPQGYFNSRVLGTTRDLYTYACTTRPRGRLRQDPWTLKRINIGPSDDLVRFKRKMSLAFRLLCDLGY